MKEVFILTRFDYSVIYSVQQETVKSLINEYKTNIDKISNSIETVVKDNNELTEYLKSINNEYQKRYISILDRIYNDQEFQNSNQNKLMKFLRFYNKMNLDELETEKHIKTSENLISIVHSNNDKLMSKLSALKAKYESEFKNHLSSDGDIIFVNKLTVEFPEEKEKNEDYRNNKFNFVRKI